MGRGGMVRPMLARPSFEVPGVSPRMIPVMGAGGAVGGSIGGLHAGGNECRYSFDCRRPDCHFKHPVGESSNLLPQHFGNPPAPPLFYRKRIIL